MVNNDSPAIDLNAHDRCDGCGAQAHAVAVLETWELLFCIHHLRRNKSQLIDEGWEVVEDWEAISALYDNENTYPIPV